MHSAQRTQHPGQTNRHHAGSSSFARGGYSLVELLIVLAILAAMMAFALPALRGPLDKSRLRSGGQQVRAALAKARFFAIREGMSVTFRYEYDGQRWSVSRSGAAPFRQVPADEIDFAELNSETVPGVDGATAHTMLLREGSLPKGVKFAAPPRFLEDGPGIESQTARIESTEFNVQWSPPGTFLPNGRSEDSTVTLIGTRDFAVDVTLRGLTSNVSYSTPYRRTTSEVEALSEVAP